MDHKLIGALIGLARATEGNEELITNSTVDILYKCLNETNNINLIEDIENEKKKLIPLCYECKTHCGRNDAYDFDKALNSNVSNIKIEILNKIIEIAKLNNKNTYTYTLLFNSLFLIGIDNITDEYLEPILQKLNNYK